MASLMKMYAEEVERELNELGEVETGSDEHGKIADITNGLMDRFIKLQEIDNESRKLDLDEEKLEIEKAKLVEEKRNNTIKTVITVGTTILYVGVNIWMVKDSQKFEMGGWINTTEAGKTGSRNLFNLFKKDVK